MFISQASLEAFLDMHLQQGLITEGEARWLVQPAPAQPSHEERKELISLLKNSIHRISINLRARLERGEPLALTDGIELAIFYSQDMPWISACREIALPPEIPWKGPISLGSLLYGRFCLKDSPITHPPGASFIAYRVVSYDSDGLDTTELVTTDLEKAREKGIGLIRAMAEDSSLGEDDVPEWSTSPEELVSIFEQWDGKHDLLDRGDPHYVGDNEFGVAIEIQRIET